MLFNFSIFLSGFFILLVREKHRKTLYRFLLAKIKGWDRNNRDKNSEHDNNDINKWQTNNDFNWQMGLKRREFTILLLQITEK